MSAAQPIQIERVPAWTTHVIDGVLISAVGGRGVSWCSDWCRIEDLPHITRKHHGPATYGAVTCYVDGPRVDVRDELYVLLPGCWQRMTPAEYLEFVANEQELAA